MIKVDWVICGTIGFKVLKNINETLGLQYVNLVVAAKDDHAANDPYHKIEAYCHQHSILFKSENDYCFNTDNWRIVIGWPESVPTSEKTIVLHNSILPRYRGHAPLINSLIKGEHEIGVSAYVATGARDEGPVIVQEKIAIDYPITLAEAMDQVLPLFISVTRLVLLQLTKQGTVLSAEQDHYLASYSLWRDEEDYHVQWEQSAEQVRRLVDAVGYPYQGAMAKLNDKKILINSATVFGDVHIEIRDLGKVIFIENNYPVVVCGTGLLKITEAYYIDTGLSIFPLEQINSRFK